ncbi:MAG: hypothetical protein K2Q22_08740, partial [Cytophagales bacterium]|nr:hypothetical protein [Cytophagales bacterium]
MKLKIRKRICKWLAAMVLVSIWSNILYPLASFALTSGPTQPEFQSFEPAGTTEMVNLFSGDFTYNIPVLEVPGPNGGYPLNLHYNAGISMDQEASWVGLGWNLNPGVMTRQVRGIPDEFNGVDIKREFHIKDQSTVGASIGASVELFGGNLGASLGIGVYNNNYKGVGYTISPSLAIQAKGASDAGVGFNLTIDSQEGVGANASLSLGFNSKIGIGIGNEANSGLSVSFTPQGSSKSKTGSSSHDFQGATYSFSQPSHVPAQENEMAGVSSNMAFKIGGSALGLFGSVFLSGFYTNHFVNKTEYHNNAYGYLHLENSNQNNDDDNGHCTDLLDFTREKDGMIRKNSPNLPIPNLTHDVYMANAQGMVAMFRPYRNDIGTVFDPYVKSNFYSFNTGFEVGVGQSVHVGGDVVLGYGFTESGKWSTDAKFTSNGKDNALRFVGSKPDNGQYEPTYFKVYGEKTADDYDELSYIGNDVSPVRVAMLSNKDAAFPLDPDMKKLDNKYHNGNSMMRFSTSSEKREPRATVISPRNGTNFAKGMEVVQEDGSRYIYGQPVLNTRQVEYVGSIKPSYRGSLGYKNASFGDRD